MGAASVLAATSNERHFAISVCVGTGFHCFGINSDQIPIVDPMMQNIVLTVVSRTFCLFKGSARTSPPLVEPLSVLARIVRLRILEREPPPRADQQVVV